jgi:hypothetical protein
MLINERKINHYTIYVSTAVKVPTPSKDTKGKVGTVVTKEGKPDKRYNEKQVLKSDGSRDLRTKLR